MKWTRVRRSILGNNQLPLFRNIRTQLIVALTAWLVAALLLSLAFARGWSQWIQLQQQSELLATHESSESLSELAGTMARERGLTYLYLHSPDPISGDETARLKSSRESVDRSAREALASLGGLGEGGEPAGETLDAGQRALSILRERADFDLEQASGDRLERVVETWFESLTEQIQAIEDQRLASVQSMRDEHDLSQLSELRHALWRVSEYAGRERAVIGALLTGSGRARHAYTDELASLRVEIERAWAQVQRLLQTTDWRSSRIELRVSRAQTLYFEVFTAYRDRVVQGLSDGEADEPAGQWFTRSTQAIDSVLDLNSALSDEAASVARSRRGDHRRDVLQTALFVAVLLVLSLGGSFLLARSIWWRRASASRWYQASEASDELLRSAGDWALERGVIYSALSAKIPEEPSGPVLWPMVKDVQASRARSGSRFLSAIQRIRVLHIGGLEQLIKEAENCFVEVQKLRIEVDRLLPEDTSEQADTLRAAWRQSVTDLIVNVEELHLVALHAAWNDEVALSRRLENPSALKHYIWVMSEYSGRERAVLGGAISSAQRLTDPEIQEIDHLRGRVDAAWQIVRHQLGAGDWSGQVDRLAGQIESERPIFEAYRTRIVDAGQAGPDYPCTSQEWIGVSTKMIDRILSLSKVVGTDATDLSVLERAQVVAFVAFVSFITLSIGAGVLAIRLAATMP